MRLPEAPAAMEWSGGCRATSLRCRARVYLRHASQAIKERAPDSPVVPRALSLVNWDNERLWQRTAMDVPPIILDRQAGVWL